MLERSAAVPLLDDGDAPNARQRFQALRWRGVGRGLLNFPGDVHSLHHLSEGGEPLPIGIALAAEIEFGLIVDANEELARRRGISISGS